MRAATPRRSLGERAGHRVEHGARGFRVRVPESWYEFDVWRATRTGDLARLVDARIAAMPDLAPYRGRLLKFLRELAADAERKGAVFCAGMAMDVEGAGVLTASATALVTEGAPDPAQNTPAAIAAGVTAMAATPGSPTWRRVERIDLPPGPCVRVVGVEAVRQGSRTSHCVVMQTLLPLPDGRGVVDLVLTSPQVELAAPLLELFEAISSTVEWLPAAEPEHEK